MATSCAAINLGWGKQFRRANLSRHKIIGRSYVVFGAICVLSLRPLRDNVGRGWSPSESFSNVAMRWFLDTASLLWLATVFAGVYFGVKRDFDSHRLWITRSVAVMMVPLAQRVILYSVIGPIAGIKLAIEGLARHSFIGAAWGEITAGRGYVALFCNRNGPSVLSLDGVGIAEAVAFPFSAWFGLAAIVGAITFGMGGLRRGQAIAFVTRSRSTIEFERTLACLTRGYQQCESHVTHVHATWTNPVFDVLAHKVVTGVLFMAFVGGWVMFVNLAMLGPLLGIFILLWLFIVMSFPFYVAGTAMHLVLAQGPLVTFAVGATGAVVGTCGLLVLSRS
mmetsp:Transcript_14786/g.26183  ORF Transcript_14786/g.26183 Transcript_14786/m.26183 type:complete len:336 (-) Transcript_14786:313-1320(-)